MWTSDEGGWGGFEGRDQPPDGGDGGAGCIGDHVASPHNPGTQLESRQIIVHVVWFRDSSVSCRSDGPLLVVPLTFHKTAFTNESPPSACHPRSRRMHGLSVSQSSASGFSGKVLNAMSCSSSQWPSRRDTAWPPTSQGGVWMTPTTTVGLPLRPPPPHPRFVPTPEAPGLRWVPWIACCFRGQHARVSMCEACAVVAGPPVGLCYQTPPPSFSCPVPSAPCPLSPAGVVTSSPTQRATCFTSLSQRW
jgi:hypothetical protein